MSFLTWGFILTIVSIILSIILFRSAKRSFPDSTFAAKRYRTFNAAAPFLALGWLVATLILHTLISNHLAHQSVGYSPDPYVTLPNGYVVGSLNTYSGYVHAPGVTTDVPWIGRGYVRGIIGLEFRDGRFFGTYLDSKSQFQPEGTDQIKTSCLIQGISPSRLRTQTLGATSQVNRIAFTRIRTHIGICTLDIVMPGLWWSSGSFCSEAGALLLLLFCN